MFSYLHYWKSTIWIVLVLYLSFAPSSSFSSDLYLFENQDKLIHLCMYGGISFLLLIDIRKRIKNYYKAITLVVLCVVIFSALIEILQPILSNRTKDIMDLLANFCGDILGATFFMIVFRNKKE